MSFLTKSRLVAEREQQRRKEEAHEKEFRHKKELHRARFFVTGLILALLATLLILAFIISQQNNAK